MNPFLSQRAPTLLERVFAFLPETPQRARTFIDALSREERTRLWLQAHRQGFESLIAVTGARDCAVEPTLPRVERFLFTRHRQATLALARHLTEAGIEVLLIKGAPLAERLYSVPPLAPWMRPPGDIDLFVAPASIDRAVRSLTAAGLRLIDDPRARHAGVKHSVDFRGIEGRFTGLFVELHAHLSHSPWRENLEFDALFARGESWPSAAEAGPRQRILHPIDELIFLASHGAGHRFEQLKWLFDLKLRVNRLKDVPAADLWRRAQECRSRQALGIGLWMLETRLGLDMSGQKAEEPLSVIRQALYGAALHLGPRWSAPRGLLTCLLLADRPRASMARHLVALGIEKIRHR